LFAPIWREDKVKLRVYWRLSTERLGAITTSGAVEPRLRPRINIAIPLDERFTRKSVVVDIVSKRFVSGRDSMAGEK